MRGSLSVMVGVSSALLLAGCHLTAALTYPSADTGDAENVVARDGVAYAALSGVGLAVVEVASGEVVSLLAPGPGSHSVDDVAVADDLLFTLDARDGALSVWSLADARVPRRVAGPVSVPVGPFSGVSAGGGRVVVSGGTSELTIWRYDASGQLGDRPIALDIARGQPDVVVSPDGRRAYVSTHFETTVFGVVVVALGAADEAPRVAGKLVLPRAGFSEGGSKPASFPLGAGVRGDTLYVAHAGGVAVIDVADADAPRLVTTLELGFEAVHLAIDEARAAVVGVGGEPKMAWLDVADANAPRVIETVALPAHATSISLAGGRVVLATRGRGVVLMP